ncbi:MAG: DUF177 domain-containing protein [Prevotellaceae bacterium]|jgi:uncharacterized metal-binding protein YceD (DUF177 family)|nr:DUF177 domain-containing protein [Prevotellaceae bacterium]
MPKFEQYNIPLKDMKSEKQSFEFNLDDVFFKKIDSPEVQRGSVKATVNVKRISEVYELLFDLDGVIKLPCDRCLDDMNQLVRYKDKIQVKLGVDFSEEGEIVVVPEKDGVINIAWFLYEFIVLNIPMKHVHPSGECNKTMAGKLKKHLTRQKDDEDDFDDDMDEDETAYNEDYTDPRWDILKNISETN